MAKRPARVVCLDTHIVVWLYAGLSGKLTPAACTAIETSEIVIPQMVRLELGYLFEIGRITVQQDQIVGFLLKTIGARISDWPLAQLIDAALQIDWTRDVFDRMIAAEAIARGCGLISADDRIRGHLPSAVW